LKNGIMFLGYLKYWKNGKLIILTNNEGVIDSMSKELMDNLKIR